MAKSAESPTTKSSSERDNEPPKSSNNTSLAFGAYLIQLGSKTGKTKGGTGAVVFGSVAVAVGSGALDSVAMDATVLAARCSTSLNMAYSNADTMNQFEG
ncbi:hypothetical protein NW762_002766 [Fusarium torreyae]|uniref:Uncharacterized protein n=1 Tax=Fusarium torreyae TaxID=1237075 RepID=A0A9W8VMX9_9HYPO|nr:hypothetical protein NW762_002766 [Fusarium torreyae]